MAKQIKKACGASKKKMTKVKDVKKATVKAKPKANKPMEEKKPKAKVVNVRVGNGEPVLTMQYMRNKAK